MGGNKAPAAVAEVVDVHGPKGEEGTHLVVVAEDTLKLQ